MGGEQRNVHPDAMKKSNNNDLVVNAILGIIVIAMLGAVFSLSFFATVWAWKAIRELLFG